jgi:hypothetical protein
VHARTRLSVTTNAHTHTSFASAEEHAEEHSTFTFTAKCRLDEAGHEHRVRLLSTARAPARARELTRVLCTRDKAEKKKKIGNDKLGRLCVVDRGGPRAPTTSGLHWTVATPFCLHFYSACCFCFFFFCSRLVSSLSFSFLSLSFLSPLFPSCMVLFLIQPFYEISIVSLCFPAFSFASCVACSACSWSFCYFALHFIIFPLLSLLQLASVLSHITSPLQHDRTNKHEERRHAPNRQTHRSFAPIST